MPISRKAVKTLIIAALGRIPDEYEVDSDLSSRDREVIAEVLVQELVDQQVIAAGDLVA
jgi:hypothetical protein